MVMPYLSVFYITSHLVISLLINLPLAYLYIINLPHASPVGALSDKMPHLIAVKTTDCTRILIILLIIRLEIASTSTASLLSSRSTSSSSIERLQPRKKKKKVA